MNNKENDIDDELFCDVCGMTYKEFLETGEFRCENCYRVFKAQTVKKIKEKMVAELKKEHYNTMANSRVIKKSHGNSKIKARIQELEKLLEMCYKSNDNEKAKVILSELNHLKQLVEIEK